MASPLGVKGNAVITVAALMIIIYGLQAAQVLVVPFLLAVFLALITMRPMLWMQSRHIPAALAALVIMCGILLLLTLIVTIISTSVADFAAALPAYQTRLEIILEGTLAYISTLSGVDLSMQGVRELVDPGWALRLAGSILGGAREVLTNALLMFLTMIFILLEASGFPTKLRAAFGETSNAVAGQEMFLTDLGRYLSIKTAVSLVTGMCAWLVTSIIGLDFPLLWGMLAFLLNYIPTIGSILAAIPAVLLALIKFGWPEAGMTAGGYIVINIMFGNLLEPRLMGHGVGISPLVVFVGLFFWGWVLGPVGMLLSVPLTMSVKMALETDESTRWIAVLIGSGRDAQYVIVEREADHPDAGSGDNA